MRISATCSKSGAWRDLVAATMLPAHYAGNSLTLAYRGLDGETRRTAFGFSVPVEIKGQRIRIPFDLAHGETRDVTMTVSSSGEPASPDRISFLRALKQSKRTARATVRRIRPVTTSNAAFEAWLHRSASDLSLLVTQLSTGPYPYAGIPWFSAPFGRDAVVTAMQVLWLDPSIARGRAGVSERSASRRAVDLPRFRTGQDRA